jgi:enoyl-CoA hydratase
MAETFTPDGAVAAGFLDVVVDAEDLESTVRGVAAAARGLSVDAHAESKLRARGGALAAIRAGIEADAATWQLL